VLVVPAVLAAAPACAPDESSVGAVTADAGAGRDARGDVRVPRPRWWTWRRLDPGEQRAVYELPLSAVTGTAVSSDGVIAGGVSADADLFWDAWLIPSDGEPPRRLATIGDRLLSVDASGALWTSVVSEDESGATAFEVRLSPADGSASVLLSPDIPADFSADRAVADGNGGRLLIGTEGAASDARLAVFAVDSRGDARRLPCPPTPASPLVLSATLAASGLQIEVLYAANEPPSLLAVPVAAQ
jgi:hypothetical protein